MFIVQPLEPITRESATPILSLCNYVFTDQVVFSIIFEHFSPRKWKHRSIMRAHPQYDNITKRSKC